MSKIEKGIPAPDFSKHKGFKYKNAKYPFAEMEVGDSCFFEDQGNGGAAHASAVKCGQRNGLRFTSKQTDGGIRIWRVA